MTGESGAVLAFLSFATVINLALLLWSWSKAPFATCDRSDLLFPAGAELEPFTGMSRLEEQVEIGPAGESAYAFVFLSKGCPKCRAAAETVIHVATRAAGRGVAVWLATAEKLTAADLGRSDDCERFFLDLPPITYRMLNPRRASPAYLFIGTDMIAQASGFVGDENWRNFSDQLGPRT